MSLDLSIDLIRKMDKLDPDLKDILFSLLEELEKHREKSVSKTEFNELKDIVKELAEAQKRTENRVEELAEAQKRTENRVEELVEAQKRTEEEIRTLSRDFKKMKKQVGGISTTIGFTLEDRAFEKLPALIGSDFGIKIKDPLKRDYVSDSEGNDIEVNVFGHGEKEGQDDKHRAGEKPLWNKRRREYTS